MISIHALRKESDPIFDEKYRAKLFQSTLSVRRATFNYDVNMANIKFQSTLSVRRATLILMKAVTGHGISIHALRKESDTRRATRRR